MSQIVNFYPPTLMDTTLANWVVTLSYHPNEVTFSCEVDYKLGLKENFMKFNACSVESQVKCF